MKTSNKLLIITALIAIGYLVTYDFALRAEYLAGNYKNRFYNMQPVAVNNFNVIEHNIGNLINLRVERGPVFGVWIDKHLENKLTFSSRNKILHIDYKNKDEFSSYGKNEIIIICPSIDSLTTNSSTFMKTVKTQTGTISTGIDFHNKEATTIIIGFKQASINILANDGTDIKLENNTFSQLNARVEKHNAALTINNSNQIGLANLQVLGAGELKLLNPVIIKENYKLSDSAHVTLSGSALHFIKHK
jgi:hypothetical protein